MGKVSDLFQSARAFHRKPSWSGVLPRDRRGAAALVFSLSAVTFIGLSGLATEGGTWYLEKRHGQNAADSSATAGAIALVSSQDVTTSADKAAALIGYPASSVALTTGSSTGPGSFTPGGNPANAVRAVVTTVRPRLFSGLFLSSSVTIRESAVAAVLPNGGNGCVLAGGGGLSFTGNTNFSATNCVVASNATGADSISVTGSGSVSTTGMVSSGGCNGCTSGQVALNFPPMTFQPPTADPYAAAGAVGLPTFSGQGCRAMPPLTGTVNLSPSTAQAFCNGQDLKLTNGNTVNLSPGTYFFYGANIDIEGGTVQCPTCTGGQGVTIIMTGPNAGARTGTIKINGNSTVTLTAPVTNTWNAAFDGILLYRDSRAQATGNGNQAAVQINGGPTTDLTGGMYFPSSDVSFSGNMSQGGGTLSTCTEIVGYQLTFTGSSSLDISGCSATGTQVAHPQYVALVM